MLLAIVLLWGHCYTSAKNKLQDIKNWCHLSLDCKIPSNALANRLREAMELCTVCLCLEGP